jgi:S-adenosylmethionine decarboxylase
MKAELFNFRCWVSESEAVLLQTSLNQFLISSEFEVLGFLDHHFNPHGYTAIWLLGESHLALHTFPEEQKCYVELTSCIRVKSEKFQQLLKEKWVITEQADA